MKAGVIYITVFVLFLAVAISSLAQTQYSFIVRNQTGQSVTTVVRGQTYTVTAIGSVTQSGLVIQISYSNTTTGDFLFSESRNPKPPESCEEFPSQCNITYQIPNTAEVQSADRVTFQVGDDAAGFSVVSAPSSTPTPSPTPTPTATTTPTTPLTTPAPTVTVTATPLPTTTAAAGCADPDGAYGDNSVYAITSVSVGTTTKKDACKGDSVDEYYCDSTGQIKFREVSCPLGCLDGACIAPEGQCIGSKASTPFVKNEITLFSSLQGVETGNKTVYTNVLSPAGVKYEDYCSGGEGNLNQDMGTHVTEYVCKNLNGGVDKVTTECAWGCKNGACNNVPDEAVCVKDVNGISLLKPKNSEEDVRITDSCFGLDLAGGLKDSIVKASCSSKTNSLVLVPGGSILAPVAFSVNSGAADKIVERTVEKCQFGCKTYPDGSGECVDRGSKIPTYFEKGDPKTAPSGGAISPTGGGTNTVILFNIPIDVGYAVQDDLRVGRLAASIPSANPGAKLSTKYGSDEDDYGGERKPKLEKLEKEALINDTIGKEYLDPEDEYTYPGDGLPVGKTCPSPRCDRDEDYKVTFVKEYKLFIDKGCFLWKVKSYYDFCNLATGELVQTLCDGDFTKQKKIQCEFGCIDDLNPEGEYYHRIGRCAEEGEKS